MAQAFGIQKQFIQRLLIFNYFEPIYDTARVFPIITAYSAMFFL